jgi:hypothetical protein
MQPFEKRKIAVAKNKSLQMPKTAYNLVSFANPGFKPPMRTEETSQAIHDEHA